MKKSIFTLIMVALMSYVVHAQTIGIMVKTDIALCSGSEDTGGDASSPVGETVTCKIVDIDGKVYAKTITSMASMSEVYAGQIRELKEDASRTDCYLSGFDSYVTTRWTNDGFTYDTGDTDGSLSLFLMYVLPDWAAFYFTAPFDYAVGQVQKEDETDVTAPTLYDIYVDGTDLVFDCDDANCFFYFIDNAGEIGVSFENRYSMSSLGGVTSLTAYAVDFSGNISAEKSIAFDLTIGSMKIDNAQLYYTDGEFANTSSPVTDQTLTTRMVDVNGVIYAKTVADNGSFDGNPYSCQLRNNVGDGNINQFWLSNASTDQSLRWSKPGFTWDGSEMSYSIGTLMYPDDNTTEIYTLGIMNGIDGTVATSAVEYTVGIANSANAADVTAPVISDVAHSMSVTGDTTTVMVTATDDDDIFYLVETEDGGMFVSHLSDFEVLSTVASITITAYDYSGNASDALTYAFTKLHTAVPNITTQETMKVYAVNNGVKIESTESTSVAIYSITGALIQQAQVYPGENYIALKQGIYLVNSNKVVVR